MSHEHTENVAALQRAVEREQFVDVQLQGLTRPQAYALAQLCKRLTWSDARTLSVDESELRLMLAVTDRVRSALEDAGIYVR